MKRILLTGLVVVLACACLAAFQWPADPALVARNFGSGRGGFTRGISFKAGEGRVSVPFAGELVFAADGGTLPNGYPLPDGSLAAVAHEGGLMSVITGIQPGSLASYRGSVGQGEALGFLPAPGSDRSLTYYLYDTDEKRYINPRIVLPAVQDEDAPVLRSVALAGASGETVLSRACSLAQGEYYAHIDVTDLSPQGALGAPARLAIALDGMERFSIDYDSARSSGGVSVLFSANPQPERDFVLPDGRIRLGPLALTRGKSLLTISAEDVAGNVREQSYSITVF